MGVLNLKMISNKQNNEAFLEYWNISIHLPMPPPVDPMMLPVTFPFENGTIKLVTVIDPVSSCHTVVCDLCDKSISLGVRAASKPLFNHWGADPCQRSAFKRYKKEAKERIFKSGN